jgi:hypothetical protein
MRNSIKLGIKRAMLIHLMPNTRALDKSWSELAALHVKLRAQIFGSKLPNVRSWARWF